MDTTKVMYDGIRAHDSSTFDTSIDIKNLETGEVIFKGLKNKVIISGSSTIARKLFEINTDDPIPSYNKILNLYPYNPVYGDPAVSVDPKVLLFCCGTDGCGSENSQVYPVDYTKCIHLNSIIPFRCQPSDNDLSAELRKKYFGRKVDGDYIYYYFKTFENPPKLTQRYMDGTPIGSDVFTSSKTSSAETFIEINMKITKDDMRDYFYKSGTGDRARINCLSLCTACPVEENGQIYYVNIRPLTKLNFPNESLIDISKGIEISYHIYM